MSEWVKPRPLPDNVSAPYWAAAREGRLLVQECPRCGNRQWYPRALCTRCAAEPEWLECTGNGVVYTYELEEGPRVMGNVIGIDIAAVHIGLSVEATFVDVADDIGIPQWRRRAER
jgi:uncharacterized OB-fold protein